MVELTSDMSQKSQSNELPDFFNKDPELKARIQEYLKNIPDSEKQKSLMAYEKFVTGELTWAEVKNIPKSLLKELAKAAYNQLQKGELKSAEVLFKGLSIIDHNNWYYRAALGAIFQKQKDYENAIEEFTVALQLNEDEYTSLLNRGECYLQIQDFDAALEDFGRIQNMPLAENNIYKKRAKILSEKILSEQKSS